MTRPEGGIAMLSAYPACFFKEDAGYSVVFPDLDRLSTCGETLDEALTMAVDCLAGHLYLAQKDGTPLPKASAPTEIDLEQMMNELEIRADEAFVNLVTVDVAEYAKTHFERSVKKTLTIPAWLNEAAQARNINFSQVLQEALKLRLNG